MESQNKVWKIGVYLRLSRDDKDDISSSIKSQEMRIMSFLSDFEENYEIEGVYIDDGFTGTDTDRDSFKAMISGIYKQKITCVIVKDLSRFSRNISDASYYLENLFVAHDIRFISVELPYLDSYKYPDQMNSILVPMQNLINDDFCRQTSVKIRSVLNTKRKNGQFIGAFAPYGYKKDPNNKNKLIIDADAALIVKKIYHWYVKEGYSKLAIAKKLNTIGIPNPSHYKKLQGLNYVPPKPSDNLWCSKTVSHILQNQIYTGDMVQGKYRIKSYKVHKQMNTPKEEWFVVPNTHDPIISKNLFQNALKIQNSNPKQPKRKNNIHTLSGYLYCFDCKKAMVRIQGGSTHKYAYYCCRTYREKSTVKCTKHTFRADRLEKIIITILNLHIKLILGENLNHIRPSKPKTDPLLQNLSNLIIQNKNELEKIQKTKDYLYIDYRSGELNEEEYKRIKETLTTKENQLNERINSLKKEISAIQASVNEDKGKIIIASGKIPDLNRQAMSEFIEKIEIHKNQSLEIWFKYKNII